MLDNEPTTEAADTAATAQPTASTRSTAKKAPAAKKTTTRKRTVKTAPDNVTAVPTQSDAEAADPAPAPVKKAAAKKAAAKKTPAKKAAAKAPAKKTTRAAKTTADQDIFPQFVPDDAPETAAAAPAKKTTRKRTTKKAAAPDLLSADSPVTDGPVAEAASTPDAGTPDAGRSDAAAANASTADAPARKRTSRRRTAKTSESTANADATSDDADSAATGDTTDLADSDRADSGTTSRSRGGRRRRGADTNSSTADANSSTSDAGSRATAANAEDHTGPSNTSAGPSSSAGSSNGSVDAASSSTSTDGADSVASSEEPSTRRTRRRAAAPAAVLFQAPTGGPQQTAPQQAEPTEVEATSDATPEPGADEQPTGNRRRRSRRNRDAEARETEASEETTDAQPQAASADDAEPAAEKATTRTRSRSARKAAAVAAAGATTGGSGADGTSSDGTGTATLAPADADVDEESDGATDVQAEDGEEGGEGTRRRRRRRGGRRRRKSGDGADDSADDQSDDEDEHDTQDADQDADASEDGDHDAADSDEDGEAGSSSRRRRRRRRRKGEDSVASPDDPDETVVRVREPRSKTVNNEITAVEGSTRLEAKKQRRREGRAAGRRRAPIVTEAEFLARRESVERTMVIRSRDDLTQIAVSEDNVLVEHYVTTAEQTSLIGNVYLGRVQNVLPSMEAAFIDIGKGRNAVLYAGEVDWATLGGANGPRKIEQVLKSGQSVLVQVTKDPIGHKGARLTNQISLPGRYVVYVPRGGNGGISRKLPDTERNRLKTILKDIVPDEAGVIVRTAAEGASEEELTADVSRLQSAWEDIDKKSKNGQAPQLLYGEPDLLIRVVRDLFTEDFAKLVISGDRAYEQVREYVAGVAPHLADRVEQWSGDGDVFANYRIDEQIKKALDRKVWLPSGGSLIIDRTEAMTVVDVNTGKFTGSGGNLEETVTKNNLEAAEEIVRQLRLRDIGGIIVIDFIDMVLESNRDLVLRRLVECLGRDRTKHQVAEVTSLGLVQMTRKRIGTGLLEAFSENCDHCGGRGLILHDEPKESRRRDSRNGQGNGNGSSNGNGNGQSNGNGHDHGKSAPAEEGGRKSSRRRRGKGRGEEEATEAETAQHNADAAQKLAQIAAATVKKDSDGTPEPTGYPVSAADEEHVSPEATGFPEESSAATTLITETPAGAETAGSEVGATEAADPAEAADAADVAQNGATKSTRRRRSSRSRSKTATEGEGAEPSELVTTGS
ncbi:Rne/Rng family ribonuclease [Kribbella sp. NBC_00662]|uniref:Rne/Rng family ribonuclease n=1 Tax=Kribbella sp. NBC_00662 TaxID=2975969 RepID=UPI00324AD628